MGAIVSGAATPGTQANNGGAIRSVPVWVGEEVQVLLRQEGAEPMSGGDTFIQEQIDMDEQSIYQKTLRLARLIGLNHASEGTRVWRRDLPHHSVPWRPYEREADLEPIKRWLKMHHPDWQRITGCDVESEHCRMFCHAVLEAFDTPTSELHSVGTAARHRSQIQRLSRLRRAAERRARTSRRRLAWAVLSGIVANREVRREATKAVGRGETIRRLLRELQIAAYATDWACEEVAKHQGRIDRLRWRLHEQTKQTQITATQIRDRVCETLGRYGVLPESLGHPIEQIVGRAVCDLIAALQRLYDYHDAPAKYTAEYMEAVAEAGDILAEAAQAAERGEG